MKNAGKTVGETDPLALYRKQARSWRNLWAMTFAILIGFLVLGWFTYSEDRKTNDELLSIATDIDAATSPEAQARQAQVVTRLVVEIDCNQRDALQDVIDGLVNNGVLDPIVVLTPECAEPTETETP